MRLTILDRYILTELIGPFMIGVSGFLVMFTPIILIPLADLIIRAGASVSDAAQLLFYNYPYLMVLALPVAFLFATLLTIGRMTKDFEIIAMRSAGMSLKRIVAPILLTSLVLCAAAYYLNETVVPYANKQINLTVQRMTKSLARPPIKEHTFFQGTDGRYFYIRDVKPNGVMSGVFVFDKTREGLPQVIHAERARWIDKVWRFEFGTHYRYNRDGFIETEVAFKTMDILITLNANEMMPAGLNAQEMSSKQLASQIKDLRKSGAATNQVEVQYYKKWAVSLISFFAALLAAPLGLMFSRMGAYVGVAFSIILVFVHYVTMQVTEAMGNYGKIPPFFGAWSSNLIFLVIGGFLVWRLDRR